MNDINMSSVYLIKNAEIRCIGY